MAEDPTANDVIIHVHADDEDWEINLSRDLKGSDWLAMERYRPDVSYMSVLNGVIAKQVTVLGLVLWAFRRRDEPDLTYEDVLDGMTASDIGDADFKGGKKPPAKKGKAAKKQAETADERPS